MRWRRMPLSRSPASLAILSLLSTPHISCNSMVPRTPSFQSILYPPVHNIWSGKQKSTSTSPMWMRGAFKKMAESLKLRGGFDTRKQGLRSTMSAKEPGKLQRCMANSLLELRNPPEHTHTTIFCCNVLKPRTRICPGDSVCDLFRLHVCLQSALLRWHVQHIICRNQGIQSCYGVLRRHVGHGRAGC